MNIDNKQSIEIDFNRLDKLIRIDDPRMQHLNKDVAFERAKITYDRIRFLRDGTAAKFELYYDNQRWVFRPLSIREDHDCLLLASDDLYKLPEYSRTDVYKKYRTIIHVLSKAISSCPESNDEIKLSIVQLESIPSNYILGLYNQYEMLCRDLNTDVDNLTQKELETIIEVIMENPKSLSNCSPKQLQLIVLELLKINIALRGN